MNSTLIKILIQKQPYGPETSYAPSGSTANPKHEVLEKIKEYIKDVQSGMDDSHHQWKYIKAMYLALHGKKKLSYNEKEVMHLLEPVILQYGSMDPSIAAQLEGQHFNAHTLADEQQG